MSRWEWIARRLFVLSNYGMDMEHFDRYIDVHDFLTVAWLESWYGDNLPNYLIKALEETAPESVNAS